MRAPLLSFILVLAVVATVHLIVPVVCISRYEKLESSLDGYGPLEKAAGNTKEQILNAQATPTKTAYTYDQKPSSKEEAETATASTTDELPDKYVKEEAPAEVKKKKSDESDESAVLKKAKKEKKEKSDNSVEEKSDESDESAVPKKEKKKKKEKKEKSDDSDETEKKESEPPKKEKKEQSDYLDESTSSKKEKKEKSENPDASSPSKKKKEKVESDASEEDASLKKKKEKKEKSADSDSTTSAKKKEKKEKSVKSEEAKSLKKEKKEKKEKKKKEKSGEENPEEDAAPVDVSTDGAYVPFSPTKEEKSDEDAATMLPIDVSTTTTDQYLNALKTDGMAKGGERKISTPYASPGKLPPAAAKSASATAGAYASPDELLPAAKSASATPDAPDELPPAAKSAPAKPDPYMSMKFAAPAGGGGQPLQPAAPGTPPLPKLSMDMIKQPVVKILSPVIKSVCAQTQYPADCEASIGGLPGAASAAAMDSVGVLKLAMAAVRQKVVEATNAATARMNAPGADAKIKEALSSCASSYNDVKASLDTVDEALNNGDIDTASTNLDNVETDVGDCDEGFQDFGDPSMMRDHDKELNRLTSNLVAIGAALRH